MNKIFCKLTGGHKYRDYNTKCEIDDNNICHYTHTCIKCGSKMVIDIPFKRIWDSSMKSLKPMIKVVDEPKVTPVTIQEEFKLGEMPPISFIYADLSIKMAELLREEGFLKYEYEQDKRGEELIHVMKCSVNVLKSPKE